MSENHTNEHSEEIQDRFDGKVEAQDLATNSASNSLSRRSFLGRACTSTAVAAGSVGFPALLLSETAGARGVTRAAEQSDVNVVDDGSRRNRSFLLRLKAATQEYEIRPPLQRNNGDEALYPNFIGNYSQGLPHNSIGEVEPSAYQALLTAVTSGEPSDFANIPLGGNTKLQDPQGGLAFDLEGTDSGQLTIPPSPALATAQRAGEMVEDYWMALARDIPFSNYGGEPITASAITDLNKLSDFRGPKVNGSVTPATLFRGLTPGDLIGPYISQFFLLGPVTMGTLSITQQFNTYAAETDYLTDFTHWLEVQNGQGPFPANVVSGTSYLKNGRDLGAYVHLDFAFQEYLFANQWMQSNKVPYNEGNPYLKIANQTGVQTFGPQHIVDLLGEVANRALKAMWYQKWFVHRTLRPLEYGGLVQNTITGVAKYPVHSDVLNSAAVSAVFKKTGSYLLPAAYPEGNPQHPSYAEGHGVIAGACVTALKAFYNESFVIPDPMVPSVDGQTLSAYTGADAGQMTVGVELNKLASNVALGRDMAAAHWRSDALWALRLGEAVTISILRDQRATYREPFSGFTFTTFDGKTITV